MTDRPGWHEARALGIGSSDAPAILGHSRFGSAYSVWLEKTGRAPRSDVEQPWMEWGRRMEPVIAEWFGDLTGRTVTRYPQDEVHVHPERNWMRATPDALQIDAERGPGLIEMKAPQIWTAEDWADGAPLYPMIQLQHQLEVVRHEGERLSWGSIVAMLPGEPPRWWDVDRDDRFIGLLVESEEEFWRRVVDDESPEMDGYETTREALDRAHPRDNGLRIILPEEATDWDRRWCEIKAELAELATEKTWIENNIRACMGSATTGLVLGGGRWTWQKKTTDGPRRLSRRKR